MVDVYHNEVNKPIQILRAVLEQKNLNVNVLSDYTTSFRIIDEN